MTAAAALTILPRLERSAQLVPAQQPGSDLVERALVVVDARDHHADPLAEPQHVALAERGRVIDQPAVHGHAVAAAEVADRESRAYRGDLGVLARDLRALQDGLAAIGSADDVPSFGRSELSMLGKDPKNGRPRLRRQAGPVAPRGLGLGIQALFSHEMAPGRTHIPAVRDAVH